MSAAGIRAGRAFVEITGIDKASEVIDAVEAKFRRFAGGVIATGAKLAAMGLAMNAPLAGSIVQFAAFDDAMREVGAVANANAEQLASMTEVAEHLGRTTSYTAAQVAGLMAELARGGYSPDQINAMTASVLRLARATGTDTNRSAEIVVETLNQFGLAAGDAARVSDVLTMAANATNVSVDDLGESLKYAGPVAADLGMSLEETVAMLGQLGNAGIKGSDAGTSLRRLGVISAATGEALYELFGIRNTDTEGNLKKLPQILDEIGTATANLPVAERVQLFEEAFGLLGITAASVLGKAGSATQDLTKKLDNSKDSAKNAAAEMDAGLGGAFRVILSAAEGVWLAIGRASKDAVQPLVQAFATVLGDVAKFIERNKELVVVFGTIASAVIAGGAALIAIGVAVKTVAMGVMGLSITLTVFLALAKAAGVAAGGLMMLSAAARLVTFSFGVLAVATKGLGVAWGATVAAFKSGQIALLALRAALFGASGAAVSMSAVSTILAGVTSAMPMAAGMASAAYTLLGGVFSALMAPTSLLATMGGVLSAVWAAAGTVVATAWSVIIAPLVPFIAAAAAVIAVVGGISAVLVAAAARAGLFSSAWYGTMRILGKFVSLIKTTFGGVMSALQGGQYVQAVKILWAGVKAAFWTGVSEAFDTLSYLFVNAIPATINFGKSLLSVLWDIFKSIPKLLMSALTGGGSLAETIGNALTNGLSGLSAKAADSRQALAGLIDDANKAAAATKALADIQAEIDAAKSGDKGPELSPQDAAKYAEKTAELDRIKAEKAAAEQQVENDKALKERIAALNEEATATRLGEAAAERLKFAQQGATAAQLAALDAAVAAKQAAEIDDRIKSLRDEADALRMGEQAHERYKLQLMGATAEQLKALKAAQDAAADAQQRADLKSAGEALVEAMKNPLDRFREELTKLKQLEAEGLIDGETGRRAREKYQKDFAGEADTAAKRQELFRAEQRRIKQLVDAGKLSAAAAGEHISRTAALLDEAKRRAALAGEQLTKLTNTGTFSGFAAGRLSANKGDQIQQRIATTAEKQLDELKATRKEIAKLKQSYS